jgi:hypothetical protein
MAFGMVVIACILMSPIILFVMGFSSRGWNWAQVREGVGGAHGTRA